MNDGGITAGLISGLSLAALWLLVFWGYRRYRIDRFRQNLFSLRDELFDEARTGRLSFQNGGYRVLRRTMNGYIRFGHRLNLLTMLLFVGLLRQEGQDWIEQHGFNQEWARVMREVPEDQQEILEEYRSKMEKMVARQLVYGSPVLVLSVFPVILFLALVKLQVELVRQLRARLRRFLSDQIDGAALAAGQGGM